MAGLRGNVAWLLAQKQVSKGTVAVPALASAYKMPFTGGNINPVRDTDQLSETDASRDQGVTYFTAGGVEGSPEFYVRDKSIGFWLWAALGADAVTGTTNFVHSLTPANSLPYITTWRNLSDTLWEQYLDCKVGSINISAESGGPMTATVGIQGRQSTRLTATPDNATPVPVESGPVYTFMDRPTAGVVTLGGGATALVRSFDLTIENNLSRQMTDNVYPIDVYEGQREVTLGFDMIFDTLDEYNKFQYGSNVGTTASPTVFTTSAVFSWEKGANNAVSFNLPSVAYQELTPEPNPGGDPIVVSVRAVGQRGGSPIVTATVKNQVATY